MKEWLRKKLREFLGINELEEYFNHLHHNTDALRQSLGSLSYSHESLKKFIEQIRSTTFAGSTNDGIKNELIIINHDTIKNEWTVVYDNGLRSNTYMGLVRELRDKIRLYNARYVAVNAGDNMLDIKARMGLDSKVTPESS